VKKLKDPEPLEEVGWGVAVMMVSSAANILVSKALFKVGKETDSVALQADAWHLRTDVYTSAGVMAGLAIIWIGRIVLPGTDLNWVDPVAAIGVALLIIKAAYQLTVESARDLLDVSLPKDEEACIRKRIAAFAPTIRGSIKQQYPGTTVHIHIEPCDCNSTIEGKCDCLLSPEDKEVLLGKLRTI
ncbi:MAG: cation diffusion facilitator family transporter, partial [Methanothrix sp.]|nr:cation diffusion facilitator family transporter [Methanothrix sp.]